MNPAGLERRRMKPGHFLIGCLGFLYLFSLAPSPALAGEWNNKTRVSSKVEFDDNYLLSTSPDGSVIAWTNEVFTDFIYKSHVSQIDLIGDLIAKDYFGPAADQLDNNIFPRLEARYAYKGKRTDLAASASYAVESISGNDLETPAGTGQTTKTSLDGSVSVTHRFDLRNSLRLSTDVNKSSYDGQGTDNLGIDNQALWTRRLTKRTDGTLLLGFNYLQLEDAADTDRLLYTAKTGLSSKLSKRLTASLDAGFNLVSTTADELLVPGAPRRNHLDDGYVLKAALDYRLETVAIGVDASHGITPGTLGDLEEQTEFNFRLSKQINERSSLSLTASATYSQPLGSSTNDDEFSVSISPSYSVSLTKDWDLLAGYRFSLKDASAGTAISNNVFLSLARDFATGP